jgi:hypothetical protein
MPLKDNLLRIENFFWAWEKARSSYSFDKTWYDEIELASFEGQLKRNLATALVKRRRDACRLDHAGQRHRRKAHIEQPKATVLAEAQWLSLLPIPRTMKTPLQRNTRSAGLNAGAERADARWRSRGAARGSRVLWTLWNRQTS